MSCRALRENARRRSWKSRTSHTRCNKCLYLGSGEQKDKVKDNAKVRLSVLVFKIDIIFFYFNDKVVAGTMYEFDLVLDHAEESAAE